MAWTALALASAAPALSGWLPLWNPNSLPTFELHAPRIAEVLPEWIEVDEEGLPRRRDLATPEAARRIRETAKRHRVRILAMASNYASPGGFDAQRITRMLTDPDRTRHHTQALVRIVTEDGFDGLDLDYESLAADDRDRFSAFTRQLGQALRARGKRLSVTVHPKTSEPGNWDGPKAQDYAAIGKAADQVRLMAYDQHWAGGEAGPIAAESWTREVVRFAKSVIEPKKLTLGVAAYGYDWSQKPAPSLTWADWRDRGRVVDAASGEYVAGAARFSGEPAMRLKRELAVKEGLSGVCIWYIGSEEPTMWNLFPPR
jgi:spore germination protein YaaH